jgi:two-component system phosphate regulon response regulator PhoB
MRNQPGVLIVEDEPAIAELIAVNLRHNGFRPLWAMDSASAQRELDAVLPDVILLDWMLPGESGLVACQALAVRRPYQRCPHHHADGPGG